MTGVAAETGRAVADGGSGVVLLDFAEHWTRQTAEAAARGVGDIAGAAGSRTRRLDACLRVACSRQTGKQARRLR